MIFNGQYYEYVVKTEGALNECNVIFNNSSGSQSGDNVKVRNYGIYNISGYTNEDVSVIDSTPLTNAPAEYFNLQGIRIMKPAASGIYITRKGNKVSKANINK